MTEFQHYAYYQDGRVAFAGLTKAAKRPTGRTILRRWTEWARRYVAEVPGDYPLAASVRLLPVQPIVAIRVHPVGRPEEVVTFNMV